MFDIATTALQPIADPRKLMDTEGLIQRIRYAQGFPAKYNFDLSKGDFGLLKGTRLTSEGDPVNIIPIAYHYFTASLFGQDAMKYVEIYFINNAGWLCQTMLSKHNAESFLELVQTAQTFYDYELGQYGITIKLKSRTVQVDGKPNTYFVCDFKGFKIDKEQMQLMKTAFDSISVPIYREDVTNPGIETITGENWNLRAAPTETVEEFVTGQSAKSKALRAAAQ